MNEKEIRNENSKLSKLNLEDAELLLNEDMNEVLGGNYDCYCQGSPAGQPG